jgi:hypothetical protein
VVFVDFMVKVSNPTVRLTTVVITDTMEILRETLQTRTLVAYDRQAVYDLLREQTPHGLRERLRTGNLSAPLSPTQTRELERHLNAWVQRALGVMPLRDALLVDEQRGRRVFSLLCTTQTRERANIPLGLAGRLADLPVGMEELPGTLASAPGLVALAARARRDGLALAALGADDEFPFPEDLVALKPIPPKLNAPGKPDFEQPRGWRRRSAALLAIAGVALLVLPLLLGVIPRQSAGLPLALITLALLVGIKAGWAGYAGSLCIWLVANLPGFHHGSSLPTTLWPALPLLALGLSLLWLDPQVHALWGWLRRRWRRS